MFAMCGRNNAVLEDGACEIFHKAGFQKRVRNRSRTAGGCKRRAVDAMRKRKKCDRNCNENAESPLIISLMT